MDASGATIMRSRVLRLALFLILVGLSLFWNTAIAHEYSPNRRWDTSNVPRVTDGNTGFGTYIRSAADDYTRNTDLAVRYCASPCTHNIYNYKANFGYTKWAAQIHRYGNPVRKARIEWNEYHAPFTVKEKHRLARHEMGHAFGLDHVPKSGPAAIMGDPKEWSHVLHMHDKDDINVIY